MRSFSKTIAALVLVFVFLFNAVGCDILPNINLGIGGTSEPSDKSFYIEGEHTLNLTVGESVTLKLVRDEDIQGEVVWTSSSSCASVEDGVVTALADGTAVIKAALGDKADRVTVNVISDGSGEENREDQSNGDASGDAGNDYIFGSEYPCITVAEVLELAKKYTSAPSTEKYYVIATISNVENLKKGKMTVSDETGSIYVYQSTYVDGSSLSTTDIAVGDMIILSGTLRNYKGLLEIQTGTVISFYTPGEEEPTKPDQGENGDSDKDDSNEDNVGSGEDVTIPGTDDPVTSDPYVNVDVDEFYANYKPAVSYMDAYYRSLHNLMSGSIYAQDQKPTISSYQPKSNGKLIRNNVYIFSEDGNTYYFVDCYGEITAEIYKGGAYVILEEVAAYVFAFGEPPANQSYSKNTEPTESPWGEYLRVNHTKFSGDTSRYPYEPILPRISGCGGDFIYYEMDIGTTGTDCDPKYTAALYNNGYSITRGAARIVYSHSDLNGNKIIDLDERYVFYTYNHYNDFQEYLNYYGGWGEMFGNITGGGTISSKTDYNPTDYVAVVHGSLKETAATVVIYYYVPKEEYVA